MEKSENSTDTNRQEMPSMPKRILVYLDGSDNSFKALDIALAIAGKSTSVELSAVFIVNKPLLEGLLQRHAVLQEEMDTLLQELQTKGERTLELARQRANDQGLPLKTYILKGRIHQAIIHAINQLNADLLLLSGWDNSYARKDDTSIEHQLTLDQAKCNVLVVK